MNEGRKWLMKKKMMKKWKVLTQESIIDVSTNLSPSANTNNSLSKIDLKRKIENA
jgi:hypothetical protein